MNAHPSSLSDREQEDAVGVKACGNCGGTGKRLGDPCSRCNGTGQDKHDPWCVGGEQDGICNCGADAVKGLDAVAADAERLWWALRPLVRLVPAGAGECWVRFKVGPQEFTIGNQPLAVDEAAQFAGMFVFALAAAFRTLPDGVAVPRRGEQ